MRHSEPVKQRAHMQGSEGDLGCQRGGENNINVSSSINSVALCVSGMDLSYQLLYETGWNFWEYRRDRP